jgi:uncharacterized membrane protein
MILMKLKEKIFIRYSWLIRKENQKMTIQVFFSKINKLISIEIDHNQVVAQVKYYRFTMLVSDEAITKENEVKDIKNLKD